MSDSSLLTKEEIRRFDDDGILLQGYKEPVVGKVGRILQIYLVWFEINPQNKFYLVYFQATEGPPFTYHSHAADPKAAKEEAVSALSARKNNLENYPSHFDDLVAWLRVLNPTFQLKDAQDAGFCMLGTKQLFEKYGFKDRVTGHDILGHMSEDGKDFIEPAVGAMVYSVWNSLP